MLRRSVLWLILSGVSLAVAGQEVFLHPVRRAAAGGVDDPAAFCSGTLLWWFTPESLEATGTNGAEVAEWDDESSNDNDLTCNTVSLVCPVYVEDTEAQWWGVNISPSNNYTMVFDTPYSSTADITVGMVYETNANRGPGVRDSGSTDAITRLAANQWSVVQLSGSVYEDDATVGDTGFYYSVFEKTSGNWDSWNDGTFVSSPGIDNTDASNALTLNALKGAADGGIIVELFACSDTVAEEANTYLSDKYD